MSRNHRRIVAAMLPQRPKSGSSIKPIDNSAAGPIQTRRWFDKGDSRVDRATRPIGSSMMPMRLLLR
jgi:hypothetical protein